LKVNPTSIPDVLVIEPKVFDDDRGFFSESFNQKIFNELTGLNEIFVQDNHSQSVKGVLRGMHYQVQQPQGKLVRVVRGAIFSAVLDIRKNSPTFGKWQGIELTEDNRKQLWIPPGLAHGILAIDELTDCLYKTTDYYHPHLERCIAWNDPTIEVMWPLERYLINTPKLSTKDVQGLSFNSAIAQI
jgi:dTDP-4-dehydrorhamnose 3,5-epimerase